MPLHFRRALACALSASMILTPGATVFAQKKGKDAPKAEAKKDAPKAEAKKDKAKKPPTKAERAKAKEAFSRGNEKFQAGDFAAAADAYKEANETIPSPQALYKVALSLDKAGKKAEALEAYKQLMSEPLPEKMADQKAEVEGRIKDLSVGTIKLTIAPENAAVTVDGQPAPGPSPMTLSLKPGPHTFEVTAPNHEPATRELVVSVGATTDVSIQLKELAPPPQPPPPPPPVATAPPPPPPPKEEPKPASKMPAYITLGLAGAGAVVGTVFGLKALSSKKDFEDKPTVKNADDTERNALVADMAFGVAVTLGITGTVLLLSGNKKPDASASNKLHIAPILSPKAQGAAATFHF